MPETPEAPGTPDTLDTPARRRLHADLIRGAAAAQRAEPVPSPCRNVCKMDAARLYCEGCLRTIPEIAGWSKADDAERRRIWQLLPDRLAPRGAQAVPGSVPGSAA
ncbi:hypothetical protein SAMN05216345_10248 [Cupriavidus sp. YR651]|uniref:DUF1289 domain-containing protein n=1 Tax=Cupriavidus sp. YR651 TaxID=1855315 RepID=UPI00088D2A4B|nr:DUF1289 domain-containing protein [Cupriavidus sp. YR651]SDC37982.1 hypothetical protein SAMN05216345_10248 [Cupriavidus sp. YR651]